MITKFARVLIITLFLVGLIAIPAAAATTYSISGTVTLNGNPLKGATVKISGTTFSTTSTSTGTYHIGSVPAGTTGSLIASMANYSFTPSSIAFPALAASLTGENFTATLTNFSKYSISGVVALNGFALPNVTITFNTITAVTNSLGAYTLVNVPAASTGHIVPKLTGYTFSPTYIAVTNLSGNLINQVFVATPVLSISGVVYDQATGWYLGGAVVTCGSHSATSSATNGAYSIHNLPVGTSCVLTASMSGKAFWPGGITITNMQSSLHSQNFVAVP